MPYTMIYHRQWFHSLKHNTTKSMVGILPLAPHHDSLQYIYHVHLMQRGQNWGVTITLFYIRKDTKFKFFGFYIGLQRIVVSIAGENQVLIKTRFIIIFKETEHETITCVSTFLLHQRVFSSKIKFNARKSWFLSRIGIWVSKICIYLLWRLK